MSVHELTGVLKEFASKPKSTIVQVEIAFTAANISAVAALKGQGVQISGPYDVEINVPRPDHPDQTFIPGSDQIEDDTEEEEE
jgi:hypothetical protein